jgi:hypothetical protein
LISWWSQLFVVMAGWLDVMDDVAERNKKWRERRQNMGDYASTIADLF